jgi:ubiquinone/menaquinone biosynthesis C-methylase UbiE
MSIIHYFSKDANKRARFIFDLIAPMYGWIEKHQVDKYVMSIGVVDDEIGISGKKVLDVGTGTGA